MTTTVFSDTWSQKNQKYLSECVDEIKNLLESKTTNSPNSTMVYPSVNHNWDDESFLPSIEYVCKIFGLSGFERFVLLLCAATDLDSNMSQIISKANDNSNIYYPTFSLALATFPDAHWNALAPTSPLRRFELIQVIGYPQTLITQCQLQLSERVLHYLTGISFIDKDLKGMIKPYEEDIPITESQEKISDEILHTWKTNQNMFHILIAGQDETSKKAVTRNVCRRLGINMWRIHADQIPAKSADVESLVSLWARESALLNAVLYVECTDIEPALQKNASRFLAELSSPSFVSTRERWSENEFHTISFDVSKPTKHEQKLLWNTYLVQSLDAEKQKKLGDKISKLVNQFDLNASSIQSASETALLAINRGDDMDSALWSSTLKTTSFRLSELATQINSNVTFDDLVLPNREKQTLESITANVRQRFKVYEEWGFGKDEKKGLGITTLFAGDSGTGKTMAASVIANELNLELYKIDLSMVVNKYIGETEKNLKKIFDAAEDGGAILLFDEADALFGKRSEVKDSHDRYANIEVGYLLQRMEEYRGLAILTTNMKDSLDDAFLRRLRFVVNFPAPDTESREKIWKRIFPSSVPLDDHVDYGNLAQLDVTGGHIRNIALGSAFLAAEDNSSVNMSHIRRAAIEEYGKMNRTIPNGDWLG